ncbi:MAG TPA: DUF4395 domain-containing protein [Saprospirales bacterium]|nr:DUF4395 domain-containing protein [Saprospirales bacterium]
MSIFTFGEYKGDIKYKVLDERQIRASAGILFLIGLFGSINGFMLDNYIVIPYISGFLLLNFLIGVLVNPKFTPSMIIGSFLVRKQSPLYIGAVQKRFAWSMGIALSLTIFILSFYLLNDVQYFQPVCMLCIICLLLIYLEMAFGICVGCWIYKLLLKTKIIPEPKERPNCMGDACEV